MNRDGAPVATMTGFSVVGSSGWYAALGVLSTAPTRSGARVDPFRGGAGRYRARIGGKDRRLSSDQKVPQGAPVEAFGAAPDQFDETGRSRLRVSQRVVGLAMHDAKLPAEPLQADRVAKVEQLRGKPGGVDVFRVERSPDRTADQPRVECISAVLHQYRTLAEPLKALHHDRNRRSAIERGGVDAVDAARVRIDPVVAVHQRLEAHEVLAHREGDRAEFHEVVRRLPGGLAVQRDEMERLNQRVRPRAIGTPGVDGIVERGKRLGSRWTEARQEFVARGDPPSAATVSPASFHYPSIVERRYIGTGSEAPPTYTRS